MRPLFRKSPMSFPDAIAITPLESIPNAMVQGPGSKSITNRALVLAALASRQGACKLQEGLISEDTEIMVAALRQLGFSVDAGVWATVGAHTGALIPAASAELFVGNSGTAMRFLSAMVSLGN